MPVSGGQRHIERTVLIAQIHGDHHLRLTVTSRVDERTIVGLQDLEFLAGQCWRVEPRPCEPSVMLLEEQSVIGIKQLPLNGTNLEVAWTKATELLGLMQHRIADGGEQQSGGQFRFAKGRIASDARLGQTLHQGKFIVRFDVIDHPCRTDIPMIARLQRCRHELEPVAIGNQRLEHGITKSQMPSTVGRTFGRGDARVLWKLLGDHVKRFAARRTFAGIAQFAHEIEIVQHRRGIQAVAVNVVLAQPVQRHLEPELAGRHDVQFVVHALVIEFWPKGKLAVSSVPKPIIEIDLGQGSFGFGVIQNQIENHPHPSGVAFVHQALQILRAAVGVLEGAGVAHVVTPGGVHREGPNRHQFDGIHPEVTQVIQTIRDIIEGSEFSISSAKFGDMQLVDHQLIVLR